MATRTASTEARTVTESGTHRVLAGVVHVLGLVTWIVGPLFVMWASKNEFVRANARHALNWQITVGVIVYISGVLYALTLATGDGHPILWSSVILVTLLGATLLFCTVAAVHGMRGREWEYPLALRVVETETVSRAF